ARASLAGGGTYPRASRRRRRRQGAGAARPDRRGRQRGPEWRGHGRRARRRGTHRAPGRRHGRRRAQGRRLMLTAILIGALALIAFAYVALPLLAPNQADPLPDDRDPVLVDLQEEKAALFRAIRELDARGDLAPERREQLRARYEAKAAKVLRAIDDREAELAGRARPRSTAPRRVPLGVVAVLALML